MTNLSDGRGVIYELSAVHINVLNSYWSCDSNANVCRVHCTFAIRKFDDNMK